MHLTNKQYTSSDLEFAKCAICNKKINFEHASISKSIQLQKLEAFCCAKRYIAFPIKYDLVIENLED